jgi:hypothetical protein
MNTEKLEKLKKSLDNKFIPDNMKDKIRVEIQKLESEIKTDETITASEVKDEVKEIEKKVEKALEVADKKEEQAKAKAPRKPRQKKVKETETKKPKSNKKSVFSVAKEIRKAGESWEDAKKRASKMMKSENTETKTKVRTETSKLLASIRRKKELKNLSGTNIKSDINRTALPKGRRVSKKGWKNQYGESEGGRVYYENRDNRTDRLAPSYKDKIYLADGGGVDKWIGYDKDHLMNMKNGMIVLRGTNLKDIKPKDIKGFDMLDNRGYADGGTIIGTPETPLARGLGISYTGLVGETGAMSSGEMFANGGGVGKKPTLKKGDVVFVVGRRWFDRVNGNTYHTAEVEVNGEYVGKSRMTYGYGDYYLETAKEILLEKYNFPKGMTERSSLWQLREYGVILNKSVIDGLKRDLEVGGFMDGVYADGGAIKNQYEGRTPEDIWNSLSINQKKHFLIDHFYIEKEYFFQQQMKWFSVEDEKMINSFSTKNWNELDSDVKKAFTSHVKEGQYAKGGGVRRVGKREYSTGRNWTNDHKHVNKSEEHEVNYTRKRTFDDGGGVGNAPKEVEERLEYLRGEIRNESISYDEIVELQSMKEYIAPDDVELLQWAGVEEYSEDEYARGGAVSPFKNMMETNTITEKEINLIKLRMNNDKVDDFTQEAIDFIWDNSPQLTPDQNKKGIDYLRNLWKSPSGKERVNNPFGYREQDALETFEYFELRGFYDAGNRYRKFYVPLYVCVGAETSFEYYISGGEINIVG